MKFFQVPQVLSLDANFRFGTIWLGLFLLLLQTYLGTILFVVFWAGRKDTDSPYLMTVQFRINPAKKKQIDGIDVFGFQIVNSNNGLVVTSGLEQIGFEISDEKLIEACVSDSDRIPVNGYWWGRNAFCLELIKRNGWKIPANYPLKF